jgi:hypothetical protein
MYDRTKNKFLTIQLTHDQHSKIKSFCAVKNITMKDFAISAFNKEIKIENNVIEKKDK